MKKVIIVGAGPAGLTAAYELLKSEQDFTVVILEKSTEVGGISRTVRYNGNRMDIGGHRFFSKDSRVTSWWNEMMPMQGAPSIDDLLLEREKSLEAGGPDPEKEDQVMLLRRRISRIYYLKKFFDYPISMKWQTFKNMGFSRTILAGCSYLKSAIHKREENTLEDFYINRFGKVLYGMFFEGYTEKLWGRHPSGLSADWGAQRVKGLSIFSLLKNLLPKKKNSQVETSLIEEFLYPKFGPGQLWETVLEKIEHLGGEIRKNSEVTGIQVKDGKVTSVSYLENGVEKEIEGDILISSMPLKDLALGIPDIPSAEKKVAEGLPYRDFVTVGLLLNKLNLKNETEIKTLHNIIPDCWIYVQDTGVKLGRIQVFNNWSPYLVSDPVNTVWVGLEYFCAEGDDFWNMEEKDCVDFAINELIQMGVIENGEDVLDSHRECVQKAYPAYFDTYEQIDELREYLDGFSNLYCIGRNGQHRYNNMDHSMATAFETVDNILSEKTGKENIWSVNTEKEYHEESGDSDEKKKKKISLSLSSVFSWLFFLAAFLSVTYYIFFPGQGFFHSDCTDTLLWANATYESGKLISDTFSYAAILPMGGSLLMLPWIPLFGVSMMTHMLGMFTFLVLFSAALIFFFRSFYPKNSAFFSGVFLLLVSGSDKLREIFWGHVIYYSLGLLFLLVSFSLCIRFLKAKKRELLYALLLSLVLTLSAINGFQIAVLVALPFLGAVVVERFFDKKIPLFHQKNSGLWQLFFVGLSSTVLGFLILMIMKGDVVAAYADSYSTFSEISQWGENGKLFFPHWFSLQGILIQANENMFSVNSILHIVRILAALVFLLLPVYAGITYKKIKSQTVRLFLWCHYLVSAFIIFGFICGKLSAANWRLVPMLGTAILFTIVFLVEQIKNKEFSRILPCFLCLLVAVSFLNFFQIKALPKDYGQDNTLHVAASTLQEKNLDYGYATFWNANAIWVISNDEVKVRTIHADVYGVRPRPYQSEPAWYEKEGEIFLLLTRDEYQKLIESSQWQELLPILTEEFEVAEYQVLVFSENIFSLSQ